MDELKDPDEIRPATDPPGLPEWLRKAQERADAGTWQSDH